MLHQKAAACTKPRFCALRSMAQVLNNHGAKWELTKGRKLTPVLAVGSNAAPAQLERKFSPEMFPNGVVIPVLRCVLPDFDVVYAPLISSYGSCTGECSPPPQPLTPHKKLIMASIHCPGPCKCQLPAVLAVTSYLLFTLTVCFPLRSIADTPTAAAQAVLAFRCMLLCSDLVI